MKKYSPWIFAALWLLAVGAGLGMVLAYDFQPGRQMSAPGRWPAGNTLSAAADQPTLVMFAHPNCPCTRASIGELAILMTHCQGRVRALVIFLQPKGAGEAWLHTDLWRSAAAIPGVAVLADAEGTEARLFRATTSGQVVLYDSHGKLLFSGGITASRGHSGDNTGRSTITKLLHHEATLNAQTPVFGCPLFDPASPCDATGALCKR